MKILFRFSRTDNTRVLINEPYEKLNHLISEYNYFLSWNVILYWTFNSSTSNGGTFMSRYSFNLNSISLAVRSSMLGEPISKDTWLGSALTFVITKSAY